MDSTTIESRIRDLDKSPMFNLFLSNKELFHSNFLKWYLEVCNPGAVVRLFNLENEIRVRSPIRVECSRESKHIDLDVKIFEKEMIDDSDPLYRIIVENKFKSVPQSEQLSKYYYMITDEKQFKNDKTKFVLLSLIEPGFDINSMRTIIGDWVRIDYTHIVDVLSSERVSSKIEKSYYEKLVSDYCEFVITLDHIAKEFINGLKDNADFLDHDDDLWREISSRHLHDLFDKIRYSFLAEAIKSKLDKAVTPIGPGGLFSLPRLSIAVDYGFTRGTGLTSVDVICRSKNENTPGLSLVIQLQNRNLKLAVQSSKHFADFRGIAEKILDNGYGKNNEKWFDFSRIIDESVRGENVYPLKDEKKFNKYGNTFLYKSIKFRKPMTLGSIVDVILDYIIIAVRLADDGRWFE